MKKDISLIQQEEYDNIALGKTIRFLREKQNLTQAELAARSSLSTAQICRLENGVEKKKVPLDSLIKISPHLCVSLDYLLSDTVPRSKNDDEKFFDCEGKQINLYLIARDLYFLDAELLLLLSSVDFLSDIETKNFIKKWIKVSLLLKKSPEKSIIHMFESLRQYCVYFLENILSVIHDIVKRKEEQL